LALCAASEKRTNRVARSAVMGEAICIVSGGQTEVDRAGLAVASEEYRRDLKKIYAQLEEPRGWGGPE
jgi:hypothetical protein